MKKCYCSGLKNDTIFGVKITECCKKHDNDSGQAGDFNFVRHAIDFYNCLRTKLNIPQSLLVAFGGTLFVILKMPLLIYKKLKFRNRI